MFLPTYASGPFLISMKVRGVKVNINPKYVADTTQFTPRAYMVYVVVGNSYTARRGPSPVTAAGHTAERTLDAGGQSR